MTATADFTTSPTPAVEPLRLADGGRMIVQGAQRLLGASLALAAVGMWFAPGASAESDVMLFKLIFSLTAVLAGLGLIHASAAPKLPEIEIDTIRRQIRVVRRQPGAVPTVLQSCGFADLSAAEYDGSTVRLWDETGVLLAEVSLADRTALFSLIAGLRDEGKIT